MTTLLFDAALLPEGWAHQVSVAIDRAGDIIEVQPEAEATGVHRVSGCALPGIPNLHSHAHQRAMAGLTEFAGEGADNFWSWREVMYRFVARLTPDQLEAIAAQLYLEMVQAGYTAVAEFHYLHHDTDGRPYQNPAEMSLRTCSAAARVGIAMTCLPVLYRFGDFGEAPPADPQKRFINPVDRYLDIVDEVDRALAHDAQARTGIAFHSLRAVNRDSIETVLSQAAGSRPVHIHIAEQTREVDGCVEWSGQRPVDWLLSNLNVDGCWCLVHATHMDSSETNRLAGSGAVAGLCPTTEANLGDGFFEVPTYLSAGGRIGLGSDSQISVNPVEEMRWLEYGQRLQRRTRNVITDGRQPSTGRALFELTVAGGAQACGMRTGRIEPGCRADLIVLDTAHPLLNGREGDALLDSWIFAGNANLVRDVFIGGRRIVTNGKHALEDRIAADFKRVVRELADTL